jgi:hypothetical protein
MLPAPTIDPAPTVMRGIAAKLTPMKARGHAVALPARRGYGAMRTPSSMML